MRSGWWGTTGWAERGWAPHCKWKTTVIGFIWFVSFVWLNETHQMDQTNIVFPDPLEKYRAGAPLGEPALSLVLHAA
jgi:hypothetical protein